jgi:hypothetical protein
VTDIAADPSQISRVNYTLHLPKDLTVTDIQYLGPVVETFTAVLDLAPVDSTGKAQFTAFTTATTTSSTSVATTASAGASAGIAATQKVVNGQSNKALKQDFTLNPTAANTICLGTTTLIGSISGTLTVPSNVSCTVDGVTAGGNLVVQQGGALVATNVQIKGALQASGAAGIQIAGGSFSHGMSLQTSTGPVSLCRLTVTGGDANVNGNTAGVTIGDPSNGCDGNNVSGKLNLSSNTTQVSVRGNTITGDSTIQKTAGSVMASGNDYLGNASFVSNTGQVTVSGNTVGHDLSCGSNAPVAQASGNNVANHNTCGE